jgi:hypothetical protein
MSVNKVIVIGNRAAHSRPRAPVGIATLNAA